MNGPATRRAGGFALAVVLQLACAAAAVGLGTPPSLAELDADAGPVAGIDVLNVVPGGRADAAGVRAGEVIVSIDGASVFRYQQLGPLRARAGEDRMTFVDPAGQTREVVFPDGERMGLRLMARPMRLTLAVSRAMARDEAWNGALLSAASSLEAFDFGAAGRALDAARDAGCPDDEVVRGLAFRVASGRGDLARATELLATLPPRVDHQRLHLPGPLERYRHLLAGGRTAELLDLVEREPDAFHFPRRPGWPAAAAAVRAGGPSPTPDAVEPPAPVPSRAVNPMLFGAADWPWGADLHTHDDLVIDQRPFLISHRPGFYKQAFLTRNEPFGDFDLHARFTARLNGEPSRDWLSELKVVVSDHGGAEPTPRAYAEGEASVLGVSFTARGGGVCERFLQHGWSIYEGFSPSFFDGTTEHHLHLSRRGGRRTVFLDGRKLLDLPDDPEARRLAFHVFVVGVAADFRQFEITEPWPVR